MMLMLMLMLDHLDRVIVRIACWITRVADDAVHLLHNLRVNPKMTSSPKKKHTESLNCSSRYEYQASSADREEILGDVLLRRRADRRPCGKDTISVELLLQHCDK